MENEFNKYKFNQLIKDKFFYLSSFGIYNESGVYDFGPVGCAIQTNIVNEWRKFFVLKERMLEVDCAIVTPETVFKASGHLTKFNDFMVLDSVTNDAFRVDHLLESELKQKIEDDSNDLAKTEQLRSVLNRIENSEVQELAEIDAIIEKFGIKSPLTGNKLKNAAPFNLMFKTSSGPIGNSEAFVVFM
jgi:glycyl-tRNA synthetase